MRSSITKQGLSSFDRRVLIREHVPFGTDIDVLLMVETEVLRIELFADPGTGKHGNLPCRCLGEGADEIDAPFFCSNDCVSCGKPCVNHDLCGNTGGLLDLVKGG